MGRLNMAKEFLEKRKKYVTMIVIYKTRREKLREKHGIVDLFRSGKLPESYTTKAHKLTKRIKDFKDIIKRIDKVWDKIYALEKAVTAFTGQNIKNQNGRNVKIEIRQAKYLYYKFGLENGIRGKELRQYIGVPDSNWSQPLKFRGRFTKSFVDHPENKEMWMEFKRFYDNAIKNGEISLRHYTHVSKKKTKIKPNLAA
jgi:hypothetical protein